MAERRDGREKHGKKFEIHGVTLQKLETSFLSPTSPFPLVCVRFGLIYGSFIPALGTDPVSHVFMCPGPALSSRHGLWHNRPERQDPL